MTEYFKDLVILLVEPSNAQSKVIIRQFMELGINHFDLVTDGEQALEKLSSSDPDLVISAMYLPDMTGAELITSIRTEQENGDLVFMLISSETNIYQLEPIRQAGAAAILPKPFSANELKKALLTSIDFMDFTQPIIDVFEPENLTVLVVDDSKFSRDQIIRTLNRMGIENCYQAIDGKEAISLIDSRYFDLIVTDYNMPEVDGKQLIDYIRMKSNQPAVPILMVTTEGDMNKLAAVEQSGVSAICDKPFEPHSIRSTIEAIMAA